MVALLAHISFVLYLHTGVILYTGDVDGRAIYSVPDAGIEYAYKAEIIQYLETGEFTYDEDIED
jgi:hypothetical protein